MTKSPSGLSTERVEVEDFDSTALDADAALRGEIFEQAADDFTGAAEFGGDFLMGEADGVVMGGLLGEEGGDAQIHAAEGDFIDDFHDGGEAL